MRYDENHKCLYLVFMSKAVVIEAHGRVDRANFVTLPVPVVTSCRFGEAHISPTLSFRDISIFLGVPAFIFDYALNKGSNRFDTGEVIVAGTTINNILLTPLTISHPAKLFTWQKQIVEEHLRIEFAHQVKAIPGNPLGITNITSAHTLAAFDMTIVPSIFTLKACSDIAKAYSAHTTSTVVTSQDRIHQLSLTTTPSCYIFDYEIGPSSIGLGSDDWAI